MKVKLILFVFVIGVFSFCGNKDKMKLLEERLGKYQDASGNLTITLERQTDTSLLGKHCFVVHEGDRIDCCVDDDEFSLELHFSSNGDSDYKGVLVSCYDEEEYDVNILFSENYFKLFFTGNRHLFIPASVKFYIKD